MKHTPFFTIGNTEVFFYLNYKNISLLPYITFCFDWQDRNNIFIGFLFWWIEIEIKADGVSK